MKMTLISTIIYSTRITDLIDDKMIAPKSLITAASKIDNNVDEINVCRAFTNKQLRIQF